LSASPQEIAKARARAAERDISFKIDEMRHRGGMALAAAVAMGILAAVGDLIVPADAKTKGEAPKKKEEESNDGVSAAEDLQ
jgi:hypothetical protein